MDCRDALWYGWCAVVWYSIAWYAWYHEYAKNIPQCTAKVLQNISKCHNVISQK